MRTRIHRVGRDRLRLAPAGFCLTGALLLMSVADPIPVESGDAEVPRWLGFSVTPVQAPPLTGAGYETELLEHGDGSLEHRCRFRGQHFLSVLRDKDGGYAFRPHPGVDVNGWGTTIYPHPHLSGVALTGAALGPVAAGADGVATSASGVLRDADGGEAGSWSVSLQFAYDPEEKRITGGGLLSVTVTAALGSGQDIDVTKIASNFLLGVPLLDGGEGNTGDTTGAFYAGSALAGGFWDPAAQPGHFPQDACDWIEALLPGCHNLVDTARQPDSNHPGQYQEPIAAAWKPSASLRFDLRQEGLGVPFMFGASFAEDRATDFSADNVAVTPQLRHWAGPGQFDFDLVFESQALAGDANGLDADLVVEHSSTGPVLNAFWSGTLLPGSWERVGSLKRREGGVFSTTLKIPDQARGFVRAGAAGD